MGDMSIKARKRNRSLSRTFRTERSSCSFLAKDGIKIALETEPIKAEYENKVAVMLTATFKKFTIAVFILLF